MNITAQTKEFQDLLEALTPLLTNFINNSENQEFKVTENLDPRLLSKELKLNFQPENLEINQIKDLVGCILKNSTKTWHPGFLDKLYAAPTPIGALSELILGVANCNNHVYNVSPVMIQIELATARALSDLIGYTHKYRGGLTFPGGSASNMNAMLCARNTMFPEIKKTGYNLGFRLGVLTPSQGHYSIEKSAIAMGLGSENVYHVPCDRDGRMIVEALENLIESLQSKGIKPFFINSSCGSTVLASFDYFEEISKISKKHKLWFHIDGCYGGSLIFSKKFRHLLKGIELSDSFSINPHKLLGVPVQCSFLILNNGKLLESNSLKADYLFHSSNSIKDNTESEDDYMYSNMDLGSNTIGCGRRPDSFKLYLSWQYYGTLKFEQRIDSAITKANYLAGKIMNSKTLKLISFPQSTNVCFWYVSGKELERTPNIMDEDFMEVPDVLGEYTKKIHKSILDVGKYMIDYSPLTIYQSQDFHQRIELPVFFRLAINSPDVECSFLDELVEDLVSIGDSMTLQ